MKFDRGERFQRSFRQTLRRRNGFLGRKNTRLTFHASVSCSSRLRFDLGTRSRTAGEEVAGGGGSGGGGARAEEEEAKGKLLADTREIVEVNSEEESRTARGRAKGGNG